MNMHHTQQHNLFKFFFFRNVLPIILFTINECVRDLKSLSYAHCNKNAFYYRWNMNYNFNDTSIKSITIARGGEVSRMLYQT